MQAPAQPNIITMLNNLYRRIKDGDKITHQLGHNTENRPASSSSASAPSSIAGISPIKQCRSRWRSLKKVAMKNSSNGRKQRIASNSSRTTRASASAATYTLRTCLTTIATSAIMSPRTQRTTSVIAIATLAHAFTQDFVEPSESKIRGFQHDHGKVYMIGLNL